MTHLMTHYTTPHDKYNIRGIALARTNRKDDIRMQRRLYIDEAHTALDTLHIAVFFITIFACMCPYLFCNYLCLKFWAQEKNKEMYPNLTFS